MEVIELAVNMKSNNLQGEGNVYLEVLKKPRAEVFIAALLTLISKLYFKTALLKAGGWQI